MYRTNTCGELRLNHVGQKVTLAGWVQRSRKMGGMTFVDLRDRYGITQLVFNQETDADLCDKANKLGREYVIQVTGTVTERSSKNTNLPTGEIEIIAENLVVLHTAETPPFTIEDESDGGDDIRMQYRYLDLRRSVVRRNLELRHKMAFEVRRYLDEFHTEAHIGFIATIVFHGVGPCHTQERFVELNATNLFEQVFNHTFKNIQNIFLLDKRHFTVYLSKLGLTVCP